MREKKSFLCPFLSSTFCLFSVCCFDITFFCPLWLFRRNQRERRDGFIHTHTRTEEEERLLRELLQREREREKKKSMGKKEVIRRFVSFRCNRKGSVKKTFALREMMLLSSFDMPPDFETYLPRDSAEAVLGGGSRRPRRGSSVEAAA